MMIYSYMMYHSITDIKVPVNSVCFNQGLNVVCES